MAPGCNPHQNRPKVEYPGGCALRYIKMGGDTSAKTRNCSSKCFIVGAVTMIDLTQLRDYNKSIDRSVENELTKLMEGLTCSVRVVDYIGRDDNEPIECDLDVIEHECNGVTRRLVVDDRCGAHNGWDPLKVIFEHSINC